MSSEHLVRLLVSVVELDPAVCTGNVSHYAVFLGAYSATMSKLGMGRYLCIQGFIWERETASSSPPQAFHELIQYFLWACTSSFSPDMNATYPLLRCVCVCVYVLVQTEDSFT